MIRAKLTKRGRPVRGERVRVRGPGVRKRARTNARGRVVFRVSARRRGRVTVSTRLCGGKLRVTARSAKRR